MFDSCSTRDGGHDFHFQEEENPFEGDERILFEIESGLVPLMKELDGR